MTPENLALAVTKDPGDRHVLAAAIGEDADFIVTENVSDFPPALLKPTAIKALSADQFLLLLYEREPAELVEAVLRQQKSYQKHPRSLDELFELLAKVVPVTVTKLKKHLGK